MKKTILLFALFSLLLAGFFSAHAQTTSVPLQLDLALYSINLWVGSPVFEEMDNTGKQLGYVPQGKKVEILEVDPYWLKVRYQDSLVGYIKRSNTLDATVKVLDPVNTPQYGAVLCYWLAWVKDNAPIRIRPEESAETLITMHEGARLAFVDINDGWGRVIYHRQYGYVDTRQLSAILPMNKCFEPGSDNPIAAYTSFYKITTDESNLNRMINIQVANDRFDLYTLQNGDRLDFNKQIGPYTRRNGYQPANAFVKGEIVQSYGGGTCQVSSTLYNVVLQLPKIAIVKRRPHGQAAASYLPHGADAAVGSTTQNFIIQNLYDFPIRIDGTAQDGALTIAIYRAD